MKNKKLNLKSKTGFRYVGKITTRVTKKGKEVNSKLLYNSGTPELFQYIALCIADRSSEARQLRPLYLNLYDFAGDEESDININTDFLDNKNYTRIIPKSPIAVNPVYSESDSSVLIGYEAVLKFTIPLVQVNLDLSVSSEERKDHLNLLGLFDSFNNLSAYALVTTVEEQNGQEIKVKHSIIPDSLYENGGDLNDYILSVQWEMQFINE